MNEKELVKQLVTLSGLNPDAAWVKKNREVLSYQIFNGQEFAGPTVSWFTQFTFVMHRVLQPAPLAALIVLFFVVSGVVGMKTSGQANPNSNRILYIAKILNEKANLATTFDEKGKLALNVDYAANRLSELEEISQESETVSEPLVQELTESFNQEIASARERLTHLSQTETAKTVAKVDPAPETSATVASSDDERTLKVAETVSEVDGVVSADGIKKDGADVAVPTDTEKAAIRRGIKQDNSLTEQWKDLKTLMQYLFNTISI